MPHLRCRANLRTQIRVIMVASSDSYDDTYAGRLVLASCIVNQKRKLNQRSFKIKYGNDSTIICAVSL